MSVSSLSANPFADSVSCDSSCLCCCRSKPVFYVLFPSSHWSSSSSLTLYLCLHDVLFKWIMVFDVTEVSQLELFYCFSICLYSGSEVFKTIHPFYFFSCQYTSVQIASFFNSKQFEIFKLLSIYVNDISCLCTHFLLNLEIYGKLTFSMLPIYLSHVKSGLVSVVSFQWIPSQIFPLHK